MPKKKKKKIFRNFLSFVVWNQYQLCMGRDKDTIISSSFGLLLSASVDTLLLLCQALLIV